MKIHARLAVGATAALLTVGVAACGSTKNDNSGGSGGGGTATASAKPAAASTSTAGGPASKCGAGNGQKATGAPIPIGAIVTKQPGTDFTDITNGAKAYFDCVNANGGIGGRPIDYTIETEQTDPAQVASLAHKLIESKKIVAMVGNISLIECSVNHKYYEAKGFNVIGAGIAPECYGTPNIAAVNMGARYSSDGAAQALVRKGAKKLALVVSNVPGVDYVTQGVQTVGKALGVPVQVIKENVPIQDANSVAIKAVQAAGGSGGVVLNFTPPEALKILQAAQRQGLQGRVKWGCSTPCNTDFLAQALGSAWDGKLFVNAEARLADAGGPDMALYRNVMTQYGKGVPVGSFSQFGFLQARITTQALLGIKGTITAKTANAALESVKGFKTDMLCKPWYFGKAPLHIPNNVDLTVTPKGGKMTQDEDCFPISDAEPGIAKVRTIEKQGSV
jgi:branched-chain amino acid transport system substrate-binding protein